MMDVRSPGGGQLSPDGKRLYFSWTVTGTPQVWRLDGPNTFPVQMTGGEDRTSLVDVTPDGKTLVLSRDRKGEENPGLYLMPADGGPLKAVQHLPGVQTAFELVSDDGRWLYFRSNEKKRDAYAIYRYELATGKREVVFEEPGLWGVADFRPDGRLLLYKATGSLRGEYWECDPVKRTKTPLLGVEKPGEYRAQYGAAEGQLVVVTPEFGEFRRGYELSSGKWTPITPELRWDVSGAGLDRARTKLFYSVNEGGYGRVHVLDAKTFRPVEMPELPPADQYAFGSTTDDGRYTVFSVGTATAPPQSWVYDWGEKKLTRWVVPSAPEVDTASFAVATLQHYPARDGTMIPAFVRRPKVCDPAPCPVIVQFHGGPEGQATPGFSPMAQLWVDAGYVLVEPNVRGSDGYGKSWLDADNGPKRLAVLTDIEDAAAWARKAFAAGGTAPKVGVMGGSYGGYATLIAMTRFAGAYDAGVSIVGISSLVTFLQNTAPYRRVLRASEYGDLEKDRAALVELSAVTHIDKLASPLLLIQGATDPRVPAGESIQMYEAARKKGVPTGLVVFADEGHGAQKRENRVLQTGHAFLWFEKYLKGKDAAAPPTK
ncbi:S9 family peptidase [Acidobacteria bacterium ACD]|nr:MAG: S9 family peptidase [Acidobacteriota bacterium]MCE7957521.1 S9 family peptidase [Acidobacteria bacterium ACB2]MDL1950079.1 S9 family peptidase [Acidobacteria bacterium ACD]